MKAPLRQAPLARGNAMLDSRRITGRSAARGLPQRISRQLAVDELAEAVVGIADIEHGGPAVDVHQLDPLRRAASTIAASDVSLATS